MLSDISESDASSVCSFSNQPLQSPNIVIARDNLLKYTAKLGLIQNSGSRQSKTFTLITEKDKVSTINATNSKKKKESENFLFNENVEVEQPVTKLPRSNKKGKINKENFKVENDQNDSVTDLANCELLETNDDDYDQKKPLKGRKKKISCINIKVVKSQSKKLVTNPLISERNLMEAKTPLEKARQRWFTFKKLKKKIYVFGAYLCLFVFWFCCYLCKNSSLLNHPDPSGYNFVYKFI